MKQQYAGQQRLIPGTAADGSGADKTGRSLWGALCKISIIAFLALYLVMAMQATDATGEAASFELPLISLGNRMSFKITEEDYQAACELLPEHKAVFERQIQKLPTDAEGNKYPFYFGIYSPLCLLTLKILLFLRLKPVYALPLTNALFLALALWVVYRFAAISRKKRFFTILFLAVSPIIHCIEVESYEVVTCSFVIMAAVFWFSDRKNLAAFFLSIAGTMNQTIMAFGAMMIADYFWEIFLSGNKSPKMFLCSCLKKWKDILLYAACFVPCLIPVIISYVLFGAATPQIENAVPQGILGRAAAYVFDLNLGLLPYIPILAGLFVIMCLKGTVQGRHRLFFSLCGVTATIFAFSLHRHINCGMAGIARYNAWLLPVIIIAVIFSMDSVFQARAVKTTVKYLFGASIIWCGMMTASVTHVPYTDWTPLAKAVLNYAPQLYNPLPSTFHSRTDHLDGAYAIPEPVIYSVEDGSVRKVLVPPGMLEQCIQKLSIPESGREAFERQCAKVKSADRYYYLNFTAGANIRYCEQYEIGSEIHFDGTAQDAHKYFINGFSKTETDFAWTAETQAKLQLITTEEPDDDLILRINLRRLFMTPHRMVVLCGDTVLFDQEIAEGSESLTILIPQHFIQGRFLSVDFQFPDAVSPEKLGLSSDARELAFGITSFSLERASGSPVRNQYVIGNTVSFHEADRYFVEGLARAETEFIWTSGKAGKLHFLFADETNRDLMLQINLKRLYHAPQRLIVACEGMTLFDSIIAEAQPVRIPVPAACIHGNELELSLQFPDAVSPKSFGESEDARELAFAITSFSLDVPKENHENE